jgi:Uncharacterised protein family (UPF0158)
MASKIKQEAQNPLILRCQRLMEAFAKSDDERDFYLDRMEGFIIYIDQDKPQQDLDVLDKELLKNSDRYCMIPKLTFYETKKIMEGFVNEKVYDIDTKEKLLDVIQSKEARENFLEFIYDHHAELEKWQQYYQERSRIRIIEWLRNNHFNFVFEEDLDFPKSIIEKLKKELFQTKVGKDVIAARKALAAKAKTYYSNEALNPRPKRGRPPKQAAKLEIEHQISTDIYTTVPPDIRLFLFTPDYTSSSAVTFSSKFESEEDLLASRRAHASSSPDMSLESLNQKLATLRSLSNRWLEQETKKETPIPQPTLELEEEESDVDVDEEEENLEEEGEEEEFFVEAKEKKPSKPINGKKTIQKEPPKAIKKPIEKLVPVAKKAVPALKKAASQSKKAPPKKVATRPMRSIMKKPIVVKKSAPAAKKPQPARRIITKPKKK